MVGEIQSKGENQFWNWGNFASGTAICPEYIETTASRVSRFTFHLMNSRPLLARRASAFHTLHQSHPHGDWHH